MQRKPSPELSEPKANWRSETGQRCQTSSLAQESCYFCHLMSTSLQFHSAGWSLPAPEQPFSPATVKRLVWHLTHLLKTAGSEQTAEGLWQPSRRKWNGLTRESDLYCDPLTPSGVFQISHHHHLGMLSWTPHSLKEHHRWWSESRDINFLNNVRELK